jgi:hypothetical protein
MGGKLMAFFIFDCRMQIEDLREALSREHREEISNFELRIANCEIKESEFRIQNERPKSKYLLSTDYWLLNSLFVFPDT